MATVFDPTPVMGQNLASAALTLASHIPGSVYRRRRGVWTARGYVTDIRRIWSGLLVWINTKLWWYLLMSASLLRPRVANGWSWPVLKGTSCGLKAFGNFEEWLISAFVLSDSKHMSHVNAFTSSQKYDRFVYMVFRLWAVLCKYARVMLSP